MGNAKSSKEIQKVRGGNEEKPVGNGYTDELVKGMDITKKHDHFALQY